MTLLPPVLSAPDPRDESEGSVDPFATQAAYERLAERILPFLTVRMSRPRFLTAMSVGAHVCAGFADQLAKDKVSPPWLVFEWYVVEAHVRLREEFEERDRSRFAGWTKVRRALDEGRAIGAVAYLKTPTVFGFNGIYRRLAVGLHILTEDMALDEGGWELLKIWEQEQGLEGFVSGRGSAGAKLRDELRSAVEVGMAKGYTTKPGYWKPWLAIPKHLAPTRAGRREARWLYERLLRADLQPNPYDPMAQEMRRELIGLLLASGPIRDRDGERPFVRQQIKRGRASTAMRERLDCIDAYEGFCRPLDDGLRLALFLSTEAGGVPLSIGEIARHEVARKLPQRLASACSRVGGTSALLEREPGLQQAIERYRGLSTATKMLEACFEHHVEAQSEKPPDGKRPWFERVRGDRIVARPQFAIGLEPSGSDEYVHEYRLPSLTSFLHDLRRFGS